MCCSENCDRVKPRTQNSTEQNVPGYVSTTDPTTLGHERGTLWTQRHTQGSRASRATRVHGSCSEHTARPDIARQAVCLRTRRFAQTRGSLNSGGQAWSARHCGPRSVAQYRSWGRQRVRRSLGGHSDSRRNPADIPHDAATPSLPTRLPGARGFRLWTWFFGRPFDCASALSWAHRPLRS